VQALLPSILEPRHLPRVSPFLSAPRIFSVGPPHKPGNSRATTLPACIDFSPVGLYSLFRSPFPVSRLVPKDARGCETEPSVPTYARSLLGHVAPRYGRATVCCALHRRLTLPRYFEGGDSNRMISSDLIWCGSRYQPLPVK
jgi:hypothetical protein